MPRRDVEKKRAYDKARYAAQGEQVRARRRAEHAVRKQDPTYRMKQRNWTRAAMWRRKGMPTPTRPEPSCCEICKRPPGKHRLALDHGHESGKFRGWLCHNCNVSLGLFADNPAWLERAAQYVRSEGEACAS